MHQAIGESIALAIGVAISPLPIIALILMLLSKRSGANSLAFLVGWVVGVAAVLAATIAVGNALSVNSGSSNAMTGNSTFRVVIGIILVVLGLRRLRHSRTPGQAGQAPKWLARIEEMGPGQAFGLAFVLAALNPKNLILTVGGGLAIAQAPASTSQQVVAGVVYVLVASCTVLLPVLLYAFSRSRADQVLPGWRDWLGTHASATVGVVLLVLGVLLIGKGIGGF
jgi:hypothetical protein